MLAIIIPYYKLTYFETTLQSLAAQTDKRFTVYIGDDASPEDCTSLLQHYENQFEFVYHRFKKNIGGAHLTKQWERCIALSKVEEWFLILGDDDYLSPNFVEEFYSSYDTFVETCCVVRYATQVIDEVKNTKSEFFSNPLFENGIAYVSRKISGSARGSLSEFIFKKEAYLKFRFTPYPSAFYSDDRIVLDVSKNNSIYSINEAFVYVRISSQSLSGKAEQVTNDLFLARFYFYKYLFNTQYALFTTSIKKILVERLLSYFFQYDKYNLLLVLQLYWSSILFLDTAFFLKINKKLIKLIVGKSIA